MMTGEIKITDMSEMEIISMKFVVYNLNRDLSVSDGNT